MKKNTSASFLVFTTSMMLSGSILAWPVNSSFDNYTPYFNVSGSAVDMGLPSFSTQSKGTTNAPGANMPSTSLGNTGMDIKGTAGIHLNKSSFLGQQTNVSFQYSNLTAGNGSDQGPEGRGLLRYIDGRGIAINPNLIDSINVMGTQTKVNFNQDSYALLMSGDSYYANNSSNHPYLGPVLHNSDQKISYVEDYVDDQVPPFDGAAEDIENYDLNVKYYGMMLGDKFDYNLAKQVDVALDTSVEGVYSNAKLTANQDVNYVPGFFNENDVQDYKTSKNTGTYIANMNFGVYYSIVNRKDSPNVGLVAGVSNWGAYPKILTPDSNHPNRPTTLAERNIVNSYVGLQLNVPISTQ